MPPPRGPAAPLNLPDTREASGTAWAPDATPMFGVHRQMGAWSTMLHGSLYVQFIRETGTRGDDQAGSANWIMFMARRPAGGGRFGTRVMLSAEPWTVGKCGYPNLLATGEVCDGEPLHDRQHPHDLFMELAAVYERAVGSSLAMQAYAGLAGEPALGPVAFPHRASAYPHLLSPITHHWLDSTHVAFGVVTGGLYHRRWKAEASVFNGREPDDERFDLDLGRLDSFSGRAWFMPTDRWSLQVSSGRLNEAEAGHDGEPRQDVSRTTASVTYHRPRAHDGSWSAMAAWGRNQEAGESTDALLVETTFALNARHAIFGRGEVVEKPAHDLSVPSTAGARFTVIKFEAGYAHEWGARASLVPGAGAAVSFGLTPDALRPFYDSRVTPGFTVFFTLRAARMPAGMAH